MLDGSVPMAFGDSLLLSGIGMLIVFSELALLAVMIVLISKAIIRVTAKKEVAPAAAPVAAPVGVAAATPIAAPVAAPVVVAAPVAVAAPGSLTLTDVDEPTAATVMAVVSHQTGIPLNHLDFHSVTGVISRKGIEDRDAAVIMALTAHKLGKQVNQLVFKSIKRV